MSNMLRLGLYHIKWQIENEKGLNCAWSNYLSAFMHDTLDEIKFGSFFTEIFLTPHIAQIVFQTTISNWPFPLFN